MKDKIKNLLTNYLGVEPEDVSDDDSFVNDLHMSPSDVGDFLQSLDKGEFDSESHDLSQIDTLNDLYELISP
jgi:acyl carrier protein